MSTSLLEESTRIKSAWDAAGQTGASIGSEGVTKILPYTENGSMAPVPWLAVYKGRTIVKRLNCAHMAQIEYDVVE